MILPLPAGKGAGGIGAERTVKGGQTGNRPVKPPPGYRYLPARLRCRTSTAAGVPGAKPPAKLTYGLPLPAGKGVGGIGAGR